MEKEERQKYRTNKGIQQELELQLHEQYAQNNNSYFGSIVILMCTLFAVIGAYGYIYIRTEIFFTEDFGLMTTCNDGFTLDALILTSIASLFVLAVCYCICVYQGVAQRNEQFIIDAIRRKYYDKGLTAPPKLFPKTYHPYNKWDEDIIQGHYGQFMKFLEIVGTAISVAAIIKVVLFLFGITKTTVLLFIVWLIVFIASIIIIFYTCYRYYNSQLKKYYLRQCEYCLSLESQLPNDMEPFTKVYCELCKDMNKSKEDSNEVRQIVIKMKQRMEKKGICMHICNKTKNENDNK